MSKHTPGPWCISKESPTIIKRDLSLIRSDHGVLIGSACGHPNSGFYPSESESVANARLIAAAPELYEVARQISEYQLEGEGDLKGIAQRARAAIAKATGEPT